MAPLSIQFTLVFYKYKTLHIVHFKNFKTQFSYHISLKSGIFYT